MHSLNELRQTIDQKIKNKNCDRDRSPIRKEHLYNIIAGNDVDGVHLMTIPAHILSWVLGLTIIHTLFYIRT